MLTKSLAVGSFWPIAKIYALFLFVWLISRLLHCSSPIQWSLSGEAIAGCQLKEHRFHREQTRALVSHIDSTFCNVFLLSCLRSSILPPSLALPIPFPLFPSLFFHYASSPFLPFPSEWFPFSAATFPSLLEPLASRGIN